MQKITNVLNHYKRGIKSYLYGSNIAKIDPIFSTPNKQSKLILVTTITPTSSGEGKTTVAIGLNDSLNRLKQKSILTLREPSMGPFFGMKGGATGAGKSVIKPEEEINLHFTGDLHAIASANNLIAATIDNSIYHSNYLNINPNTISWKRCLDVNDRSLRNVVIKIDDNHSYQTEFTITAASPLMTVFSLASDYLDFKTRLEDMEVARTYENKIIYVKDLQITDSVLLILKDALKINAVQTEYGNLALIHGGAFANISHGTSSILALKTAMNLSQYTITECGFGSDLGMEKFLDIVSRETKINPNLIVLVVTIKSVKEHGTNLKNDIDPIQAIEKGFENVAIHIKHLKSFNVPFIIAINKFKNDTKQEINYLKSLVDQYGIACAITDPFNGINKNNLSLAKLVIDKSNNQEYKINYAYNLMDPIKTKIAEIAKRSYNNATITYSELATQKIQAIEPLNYYICMAKTPLSFGDNPKNKDFKNQKIIIEDIEINHGAKFIIPKTKNIYLIPGMPKESNAHQIKFDLK